MEKPDLVDQKFRAVIAVLGAQRQVLARQGSVQASWRYYGGKRLGPFFRLVYRWGGKQCCVYLGRDRRLASAVRRRLRALQGAGREARALCRAAAAARKALRAHRRVLETELARHGLSRHGTEIRGWQALHRAQTKENSNHGGNP